MKIFIREVFLFIGIVGVILALNFVYNHYQITHSNPLPKAKSIVLGDSRMMTGINPKDVDACFNYAQNSENYFVSFFKLKYILENSSGIKNIILGVSYPNFSAYQDGFYNNDVATPDILNRIYSIIPLKDFYPLKVNQEKYNVTYFRNMFVYPHNNHTPFLGSFVGLPSSENSTDCKSIIQRHYFTAESLNIGISEVSVNYLDSIQQLTELNNIRLVLVNLPVPSSYFKSIPDNFKQQFNNSKNKMMGCKNVLFLDFGMDTCPNNYFKDAVHLSETGASSYSKKINVILNNESNRLGR